jgi:hypothetical protein
MASAGMILGEIPAVATFPVREIVPLWYKVVAVDVAGNKSLPSIAVQSTAQLIDSSHIAELTASKITAGEMTADVLIGGSIRTAKTGARVEMNLFGIQAYNANNVKTVDIDSSDGSVHLNLQDAKDGLEVNDANGIQRLHVGTSDVTIRDASGHDLWSNSNASGWGLTQPNIQTGFTPILSWATTQNNTLDANYYTKWVGLHVVNHPIVHFGVKSLNSGATGIMRWYWQLVSDGYPGDTNPAGTMFKQANTGSVLAGSSGFTYNFPQSTFGLELFIVLAVRMSTGTGGVDWVSAHPLYFYGSGS